MTHQQHVQSDEKPCIAVSSCLLGSRCRFDGKSKPCDPVIALKERFTLVPICPETLGKLPIPRTPSEVTPDRRVVSQDGDDRTAAFLAGSQATLNIMRAHGCTTAVLKAKSPSCGVHQIYDGTFTQTLVDGQGIAAEMIAAHGMTILDENDVKAGAL